MAAGDVTVVTTISGTDLTSQSINSSSTYSVSSIAASDERVLSIPSGSQVDIYKFGAAVASGQATASDSLMITNLDDTNFVRIRFGVDGGVVFDIQLDAGKTIVFPNRKVSVHATDGAFSAFSDADIVYAQADTAAVKIKITQFNA